MLLLSMFVMRNSTIIDSIQIIGMDNGIKCNTRWLYDNDEEGVYKGDIPEPVTNGVTEFVEEKYYNFIQPLSPATKTPIMQREVTSDTKFPRRGLSRQSPILETARKMTPVCPLVKWYVARQQRAQDTDSEISESNSEISESNSEKYVYANHYWPEYDWN